MSRSSIPPPGSHSPARPRSPGRAGLRGWPSRASPADRFSSSRRASPRRRWPRQASPTTGSPPRSTGATSPRSSSAARSRWPVSGRRRALEAGAEGGRGRERACAPGTSLAREASERRAGQYKPVRPSAASAGSRRQRRQPSAEAGFAGREPKEARGVSELIGVARPRIDAPQKVTGATRYAADQQVPGLLHARLVLSWEAHALVRSVDAEQALAVPGVVAVLTAEDLPLASGGGGDRTTEPLAQEEVVFAGQPVAIVVAESEASAEDAAELVVVEYDPLPPVLDLEQAIAPEAPPARRPAREHGGSEMESSDEQLSANVLKRVHHRRGDVAAALAASDAVVSGTFTTPWVYQAYVEPQVATAWVEPDGTLVVSTSTQGAFITRSELARAFGLSLGRVEVRPAPLGGAFGGKFALVEPLAAAAALALRRPVRLTLTRSEDFAATNPAPAEILEVRLGGKADGELTGLEVRLLADRGTNADWGVEDLSSILVAGLYRWQAFAIRGYGVQTNRFTFGAYRAPGDPPAAFALESLLDELAEQLR